MRALSTEARPEAAVIMFFFKEYNPCIFVLLIILKTDVSRVAGLAYAPTL